MPPMLLTARELAERLGVSRARVVRWARLGTIPSIRTSKGRWVFSLDAVAAALRPASDEATRRADDEFRLNQARELLQAFERDCAARAKGGSR